MSISNLVAALIDVYVKQSLNIRVYIKIGISKNQLSNSILTCFELL